MKTIPDNVQKKKKKKLEEQKSKTNTKDLRHAIEKAIPATRNETLVRVKCHSLRELHYTLMTRDDFTTQKW